MPYVLPPLPYPETALEPHMSRRTLALHYGKHHRGYLDTLNKLLDGSPDAGTPIEDLVRSSHQRADRAAVFNNAAQVWNHTLFWHSMRPGGAAAPDADLKRRIDEAFGSQDGFRKAFLAAATGQFGSGYAWLVRDDARLAVVNTPNAVPPFVDGKVPLACCDVWEHAYYVDYENRRAEFVTAFLEHLIDWSFVRKRMDDPGASLPSMSA